MKATILALLLASQAAFAGTFNFFPDPDHYACYNVCTGFLTSDPDHSVDSIGVTLYSPYAPTQYKVNVTIDGLFYSGVTYASTIDTVPFTILSRDNAGNVVGSAQMTLTVSTRTTCTHSGRAQHCTTYRFPNVGTLTL